MLDRKAMKILPPCSLSNGIVEIHLPSAGNKIESKRLDKSKGRQILLYFLDFRNFDGRQLD